MKKLTLLLTILTLFFVLNIFAEEKISIRLELKQNDSYRVTIPMKMPTDISIEVNEEKMKKMFGEALADDESAEAAEEKKDSTSGSKTEKVSMDMNMEIAIVFKVVNVEKNRYKLEAYYEYLESGVTSKEETAFYSTRKKDNKLDKEQQEEFNTVKSIIGKKFYLIISDKGELKELIGYEKIASGLKNKKKEDNPFGGSGSPMVQQLDKSEISTTLRGIFDVLPESPVKTGDSWSKEYPVEDQMMPYMIRTKYTLKEISATHYSILSESVIYSDAMKKQLAQVSGMGSGDIKLSRTDNLQQTQPYTLDMNIDMEFLGMMMKTNSKATGIYKIEKIL
jgi:hypothetical protein